ncbi:MAG: chitobiase/beta-hexosaminidase C-terminal domain-containing protein [Prevotella sp.]|nr:chitobiase/beta-hexosaminidase C-terminal domain-containing protein [Prevotella sp.]
MEKWDPTYPIIDITSTGKLQFHYAEGATVYYTINGSNPTTESDQYTDPIAITKDNFPYGPTYTIKAIANKEDAFSDVTTGTLDRSLVAPEIELTESEGTATVTISSSQDGVSFKYTTDGTEPSADNGTEYSIPFTVDISSEMVTVKAVAVATTYISPVEEVVAGAPDVSGLWYIQSNKATTNYLYPSTEKNAGGELYVTTAKNQTLSAVWKLEKRPGGYYYIIHYSDNTYLTADPSSSTNSLYLTAAESENALFRINLSGDQKIIKPKKANNAGNDFIFYYDADPLGLGASTADESKWNLVDIPSAPSKPTNNDILVTMSNQLGDIRYTMNIGSDPSDPTSSSTNYSGPFYIKYGPEYHFSLISIYKDKENALHTSKTVTKGTIRVPVAKPQITYTYNVAEEKYEVTLSNGQIDVPIRYTIDGTDPSATVGTEYTGSFSLPVSSSHTIKAIAYNTVDGTTYSSDVTTETLSMLTVTQVHSYSDISDLAGFYVLASDFTATGTRPSGTFTGMLDGQYNTISLSAPLFDQIDGATIKNLKIEISGNISGDDVGAICNVATGASRIYNCGVLSGSVSGTDCVGGLVGRIASGSKVRVVNCYNYADVSGGVYAAGIVGKNEGTVGDVRIALCMMYGKVSDATNISPVYGGNHTSNVQNFTEYNYYLYSNEKDADGQRIVRIPYTAYNDQLAIDKEEYLTRFPFYRHILNTHRELAALFLFGASESTSARDISPAQVDEIGHWALQKGVATYPIVEKWEENTKKTVDDIKNNLPSTTAKGAGKLLNNIGDDDYYNGSGEKVTAMGDAGYLHVNLSINGSNYTADLPITDMNEAEYDYTWGKVVLPFANEFNGWTRDYSKVCTGWEITSITGGTEGIFANYNVNDRDCTAKDLYSNSNYIYAQGGNYIVPYGVTGITITAHFANAFYLSDASYEIGYNGEFAGATAKGGNVPTLYHGQPVYTSLSSLVADLKSATNPHDQAIVLVGNFHYNIKTLGGSIFNTGKAVTIMSSDEDNNQEPDYGWYTCNTSGRLEVPPLRFDFVPNIEMGMSSRVGSSLYPGLGIWHTRGWFELTETCVSNMTQCEINSSDFAKADDGKGNNRWIANSGCFVQIVRARDANCTKLSYIQIGGNAYVKELYPGSHTDNKLTSAAVPIIVSGGQVDECYMTGYNASAKMSGSMIRFWGGGGKIGKFLGAYLEEPTAAGLTVKVDHALIGRFFGGGTSSAARIKGNIDITMNNSQVDFYCGGPEFGDIGPVESGQIQHTTVTTRATGTTFGEFYGAGFGGTSITYNREAQTNNLDITTPDTKEFNIAFTNYTNNRLAYKENYGIGNCYKFEYIFHSDGKQGVTRFYTGYAQFDLATTGNVTNTLQHCTVNGDFYGAGCQGKVDGTVTSLLTDCEVKGSAYGGGFKAESNEVDVYPTDKPTYAFYTKETGIFSEFGKVDPVQYEWRQGDATTQNTSSGNILYTSKDINMSELGNVTGTISLTIDGKSIIGTEGSPGNIYGGGNESKSLGDTKVTLNNNDGHVYGNVYGGGNQADVGGSVTVNMSAGTVEKDVYGGGALASTNINNATNYGTESETVTSTTGNTTTVNLTGGTIKGDAYGGGLGSLGTDPVAAMVYGDVNVELGSEDGTTATAFHVGHYSDDGHTGVVKSGRVFGCNNLNGSPKGDVTVTVWSTDKGNVEKSETPNKSSDDATYHLAAVYGGGNLANYTATGKKTHVIINSCEIPSIEYVYGGGNAAAVPEASVDIYGAYEIGYVFGGGNGADEYTLDNGTSWNTNPGANVNGDATTVLHGGTIHEAFGGSNKKGTITGSVSISTESGSCDLSLGKLYGAGKEADIEGDLIVTLGCMPGDENKTDEVYGGAENANVKGNVELTITSGSFRKVFGGNNQSGAIFGHIKLNIEETGCNPIKIDELYLGGNQAAYSVYGYKNTAAEGEDPVYEKRTSKDDGTAVIFGFNDHTTPDAETGQYADPELNVISATYIGQVFGGGLGSGAALYGNPTVGINLTTGAFYNDAEKGVPAKMTALGLTSTDNPNKLGIIGDVFGGGNEATVYGNTTVNIGTETTATLTSVDDDPETTDVNEQTPSVLGAYITGSVYGGGNAADVTGNTNVTMAKGFVFDGVYGGGLKGSVGTFAMTYHTGEKAHSGCIGIPGNLTEGTGTCRVSISGGQVGPFETAMADGGMKNSGRHFLKTGEEGPVDYGFVFGAGRGETVGPGNPDADYYAYVGNTEVTISGTALVMASVYGGGENGRVRGNTKVNIQGGQIGCGVGQTAAYADDAFTFINPLENEVTGTNALSECSSWDYGIDTDEDDKDDTWLPYDPYADNTVTDASKTGSDGHTYYGNVFGGGSGYYPYAKGQWLRSAGLVEGNTEVEITGGHVLTAVYGGNELTDVRGTCKVKISGGTVGVPRTLQTILGHPVTCSVYGAGKGDERTAFNKWTNVGNVEVEISGGIIYGSVFGGGEDGHVLGNVDMTIKEGAVIGTWGTSFVDGNVFGGGRGFGGTAYTAGNVAGSISLNIEGGNILGSVYGGGRLGSVGYGLFDTGETGYGQMRADDDTESGFNTSGYFTKGRGHVDITITGGTIGNRYEYVYNPSADVKSSTMPLTEFDGNNHLTHTKGGNVFVGGMGRRTKQDGVTAIDIEDDGIDWKSLGAVKSTKLTISGGTIKSNVYGGGELGAVVGSHTTGSKAWGTEISITGGTIGSEIKDGETLKYTFGSVYGGGMGLVYTMGTGETTTYIQEGGNVESNTKVAMSGSSTKIRASVLGGGELAQVGGNSDVTISGGEVGHAGITAGGAEIGNVYGAGKGHLNVSTAGRICGNADVTVTGGHIYHNIYGGGAYGTVGTFTYGGNYNTPSALTSGGTATVTITGGTIGTDGHDNGMVFGSSRGDVTAAQDGQDPNNKLAWVYDANVTIGTSGSSSGPQINGSVYGSGENGHTYHDTDVKVYSGTVGMTSGNYENRGNVYGGGCGTDTYDVTTGTGTDAVTKTYYNRLAGIVLGDTRVTVAGGHVVRNVYGGGAMGSVGVFERESSNDANMPGEITGLTSGGKCTVTINGGQIGPDNMTMPTFAGMVFGAGRGEARDTLVYPNLPRVIYVNDTEVNINAGAQIKGSVYGGSESGHVLGDTHVTVNGGTIGNGNSETGTPCAHWNYELDGLAYDKYAKTLVSGDWKYENGSSTEGGATTATDGHTFYGNVFGGGSGYTPYAPGKWVRSAGVVRGNTLVEIKDGKVLSNVYGGNECTDVWGSCTVNMEDGTIGVPRRADDVAALPTIGHLYGGGKGDKRVLFNTWTNVASTSVNVTGGTIYGSVYGGGEDGHVLGNAETTIEAASGKTIVIGNNYTSNDASRWDGNVFGGGQGSASALTAGVVAGNVTLNVKSGDIKGSVYGGGRMASVGTYFTDPTATNYGKLHTDDTDKHGNITVNLTGGTIARHVFGGGMGTTDTKYDTATHTCDDLGISRNTTVKLNQGVSIAEGKGCIVGGNIFGCNNTNASPKYTATVNIYGTQNNSKTKTKGSYDISAVYGGGNLAAFVPDTNTGTIHVNIYGCDYTSIQQVYGGGNAASTPSTHVDVYETYEIDEVFGGGNGKDNIVPEGETVEWPNPGANVGYLNYSEYVGTGDDRVVRDKADAATKDLRLASNYVYGSGDANVTIHGGTVHRVYGGSNTKGNVRISAVTMLEDVTGCEFHVDEAYGGGKSAPMDATSRLDMACIPGLKTAYGGAMDAEIEGDVELTITNGTYDRVFGGNNVSGFIKGKITVNIEETGCKPLIIGQLYGGGNQAPYRPTTADGIANGINVNVRSFTSIGDIYGGGYGSTAKVTGDTHVNINVSKGRYAAGTYEYSVVENNQTVTKHINDYTGNKTIEYKEGDETKTVDVYLPPFTANHIGAINNVFGGGNAAEVDGSTNVNIGTLSSQVFVTPKTKTVSGSEVDTTDEERTKAVEGVDIRANVYGGGNQAKVTGDTNVVIGKRAE